MEIARLKKAIGNHKSMMGFSRDKKHRAEYDYIVAHPEVHYLVKDLKPIIAPGSITEEYCIAKMKEHPHFTSFAKAEPALVQTIRKRFPHLLDFLPKTIIFQSDEDLLKKAAECRSPGEMQKKYPNEYEYILRRGLRRKCDEFWPPTYANSSVQEEACRKILETLLQAPFPKANSFYKKLCLDGYNEDLKLAFEFHGRQHYKDTPHFHRNGNSLKKQKNNDRRTKAICKKRGITLIVIPYTVKLYELKNFIEEKLRLLGIKYTSIPVDLKSLDLTPKVLWNFKTCHSEAKKYTNRSDFRNGNSAAYTIALRNGWLDEICSHMETFSKPRNYWTIELFIETIKENGWTKVAEIRKHCSGGLDAAYTHDWLDRVTEATGIKFRKNKNRKKPTREEVLWAIDQCKTLSQLRHKFKPYYRRALELGMQKDIEKKLIVMNPKSLYL